MDSINETPAQATPLPNLPKAFNDEFAKLEKEAGEMQVPDVKPVSSITDALIKARIDPNIEPDEAPMIVSIDNTPFATRGNFSCIIGKPKSKKTFLITLVVAVLLRLVISIIQAFPAKGKIRVIWFDTEQSRGHVVKAFRRALALSGGSAFHEIEVYDLRPHSPSERLQMINTVLVDMNPNKDIAFVVIDGIRDLVTDINDPVQATDISTWLMQVTANQDLHICTVLHQNKSDNNARGHLGTEIINKAESVLSVQKESDCISKVQAEFYRNSQEFKPFYFTIDDGIGLPRILSDHDDGGFAENGSGRPVGDYIKDEKHRELMGEIFSIESEYGFGDLLTQVMLQYTEAGFKTGQLKGKRAIAKCTNLGIIRKDGKVGSKGKYLMTNPDV